MNDAQIWTMIGAFTAIFVGMLTVISTQFTRVLRAEIGKVEAKIDGLNGTLNGKIDGLRGEMNGKIDGLRGEMNARFDVVNTRIDGLDRDMGVLFKRAFGIDRE